MVLHCGARGILLKIHCALHFSEPGEAEPAIGMAGWSWTVWLKVYCLLGEVGRLREKSLDKWSIWMKPAPDAKFILQASMELKKRIRQNHYWTSWLHNNFLIVFPRILNLYSNTLLLSPTHHPFSLLYQLHYWVWRQKKYRARCHVQRDLRCLHWDFRAIYGICTANSH